MKSRLVTSLIVLVISSQSGANELIQINNFWINEAPPTVRVFAGYLTITNQSDEQVKLINVASPAFEKIEFHQTRYENDMVRMDKKEFITIPANSVMTFSPGDHHLMLFNNSSPIKASDKLSITFEFGNGIKKTVVAEIRKALSESHHH